MKIALLSTFYPYRGGIAQFNANLYNELALSHNVKAFNFKRQYPKLLFPGKSQLVNEGDYAIKIESTPLLDSINPLSYYKTAKEIERWAPDLLILRYWTPFLAPSLGLVARRLKKSSRVISIVDNAIPHERKIFDTLLTNYFLKGSDGSVVLSSAVGEDLLSLNPKAHYTVIPHPLYNHFGESIERAEAHKKLKLDENKRTLLFFGLIREYKGLDLLIDAFSTLDQSYQLIIAGEPYGSFDPYLKQIENSPAKDRIKLFTHYISDEEVPLFFSAADLAVLPYKTATQSGINAIALHFDLPLVTTNVGGLKESIGDKGTGIVVDRVESGSVAEGIERYFKEGGRVNYKEAIERVKQQLSWSQFAQELIEFSQTI